MDENKLIISSTPHIRGNDSIENIMRDVLIALLPATIAGVYFFGLQAIIIIALSIGSCVGFEFLYNKIVKKPSTISDLSAIVTGLLLAFNLPVHTGYYIPIVGGFIAIFFAKMLFGGLGQNFINPALAARAFLLASYPTDMQKWSIDAISAPTQLDILKRYSESFTAPNVTDYIQALTGSGLNGCIGETSALAILIGAGYLFYKKVITWHTPVTFIGTVFILNFIFVRPGLTSPYPLYEILLGGLMLGAFFMATDYSSAPVTPKGKIIMGVGCGLLTVIIRVYGGYPEGVCYSILLMNLGVPLIDRFTRPKVFGVKKEAKQRG